jgi:tRNA dimethylallyltransferase
MIKNGLMEETHKLLSQGLDQNPTASQAIGYKEFKEYFAGKMGLDEAIALLKQRSRQYAKRQITWFKRYEQACFIPMDQGMPLWNVLKNLLR